MSEPSAKTKPGAGPAPTAPPAPAAKPSVAPDWSPRFKALEEVDKALIRLRQGDVELDMALLVRAEDFFASDKPLADPALSLDWLDRAQETLEQLTDALEGLKGDHAERLADLNPAQVQTELAKTTQQVQTELNSLKGARFTAERAVWRTRVEQNLAALKLKQERQADKLQHTHEATPEGRVIVRPTNEWWEAYTRWLLEVHDLLRDHLKKLLLDRWPKFIDEHVRPVVKTLDAEFVVAMPEVALDELQNPVAVQTPGRDPVHYRDGGASPTRGGEAAVKMPEEVILAHEIDKAAQGATGGGALGAMKSFAPMVSMVVPYLVLGTTATVIKVVVSVAIGVPTFAFGMKKQRQVRELVLTERVEKAAQALKKQLTDDFARRMARYKMDVDAFVRDYNSGVQKQIFERLSETVDRELGLRASLAPQQKAELHARKQKLQGRVAVLDTAAKSLSNVLVELEMRRRALRDEVARRATGD